MDSPFIVVVTEVLLSAVSDRAMLTLLAESEVHPLTPQYYGLSCQV